MRTRHVRDTGRRAVRVGDDQPPDGVIALAHRRSGTLRKR